MVQLVQGSAEVFDAMAFVPPPPTALMQMQESYDRFMTGLGRSSAVQFYESIKPRIAIFDYERMQRMANAAYRAMDNFWMHDIIQPLYEIGHLQHAPPKMVRWLMAEPTTRTLYHNNQCEGYGDAYRDRHPNDIGEDHYDYMVVNNGILREDGDGGMYSIDYCIEAQPEYDPDYDTLDVHEQDAVLTSWAHLARYININEDDPTSKFNASL